MINLLNNPILKDFDLTLEIFTEGKKRKWRFTCYRYEDPDGSIVEPFQVVEDNYPKFTSKVGEIIKKIKEKKYENKKRV